MKFIIPGEPLSQQRHRRKKVKNQIWDYDPNSVEKKIIGNRIQWQLKQAFNSSDKQVVMEASNLAQAEVFRVDLYYHFGIPKSDSLAQKNLKLWGLVKPSIKPDVDNCIKATFDSCNKILYKDDCQIVKGSFEKRYSAEPRTEIVIVPIKADLDEESKKILSIYGPNELQSLCHRLGIISELLYDVTGRSEIMDCKDLAAHLKALAQDHAKLLTAITKIKKKD